MDTDVLSDLVMLLMLLMLFNHRIFEYHSDSASQLLNAWSTDYVTLRQLTDCLQSAGLLREASFIHGLVQTPQSVSVAPTSSPESHSQSQDKFNISYTELNRWTDNFNNIAAHGGGSLLGQGGYAQVFKGIRCAATWRAIDLLPNRPQFNVTLWQIYSGHHHSTSVTVLGCKDCCAKHKCTYLLTYLLCCLFMPCCSKANSAFHPSGVSKWVPASAGKAKAGMVYSVSGWTQGVQVKRWDALRTHAIPERLRGVFTTQHYTNPRLSYLTMDQIWYQNRPCSVLDMTHILAYFSLRHGVGY